MSKITHFSSCVLASRIMATIFDEPALLDLMRCAIHTKQPDGNFYKCDRFAFITLNEEHLKLCVRKNHPFFVSNQQHLNSPGIDKEMPRLICVAHSRYIQNSPKFNEQNRINLAQWELDERREMEEFLVEFVQNRKDLTEQEKRNSVERALDQMFSDNFANLHKRYRDNEELYGDMGQNSSSSNTQLSNSRAKKQQNFAALSATTLRRYKKFFKLPNRSGATSKQQLLDGIDDHFESVPVDSTETIANFLLALRQKSNSLDYPVPGLGSTI